VVGYVAGTLYTAASPIIYYFNIASNANTTWNESVNGTTATYTLANGGGAGYADTASNVCIGGRLDTAVYMDGVISEVIMYNTTLTSAQRQQVETHLIRKWGISTPSVGVSPASGQSYTGFVPTTIGGCAIWLDGADATTLTLSGSTVTQWRDKSGNTRHLGVGSGTTTYASNAVTVSNSYMYVTSPVNLSTFTFFIVIAVIC
jgi:hypothetical protein